MAKIKQEMREKKRQLKKLKGKLKLGIKECQKSQRWNLGGGSLYLVGFSMDSRRTLQPHQVLPHLLPLQVLPSIPPTGYKREQWDIFLPFILGLITIFGVTGTSLGVFIL